MRARILRFAPSCHSGGFVLQITGSLDLVARLLLASSLEDGGPVDAGTERE